MKAIDVARLKEARKIAIEESIGQFLTPKEHAFIVRNIYAALEFDVPSLVIVMGRERRKTGPGIWTIAKGDICVDIRVRKKGAEKDSDMPNATADMLNEVLDAIPSLEEFESAIASLSKTAFM